MTIYIVELVVCDMQAEETEQPRRVQVASYISRERAQEHRNTILQELMRGDRNVFGIVSAEVTPRWVRT